MRHNKLQYLITVGLELSEIRDEDVLLDKVLRAARYFFAADAGSIYIKEKNSLLFRCAQNDTLSSRLPPGRKLGITTFSLDINDKSVAGYVASTGEPLNIPDVYAISPSAPYSFGKNYDTISDYHTESVLTAPLKTSRDRIIGVIQLINAKNASGKTIEFAPSDEPFVRHFANIAAAAIERAQLIRTTILRMISMAELRDPTETATHVNRVGAYSMEIYEAWARVKGVAPSEIERNKDTLRLAAMLHDVGKIAVSDVILKKPAKLTDEEFSKIKSHSEAGARLFDDCDTEMEVMSRDIALCHHERWDGKGYPKGLKGEEIPSAARVVAVADVYDALSTRRAYKEAFDEKKSLDIIRDGAGSHFDPSLVEVFLENFDNIRQIADRYKG
ncbi:MAG: HD domain-containing protein [Endomicrobiia bacterium]|nr:HD domain-containing protein [Endomicrobiia bacterium]